MPGKKKKNILYLLLINSAETIQEKWLDTISTANATLRFSPLLLPGAFSMVTDSKFSLVQGKMKGNQDILPILSESLAIEMN